MKMDKMASETSETGNGDSVTVVGGWGIFCELRH